MSPRSTFPIVRASRAVDRERRLRGHLVRTRFGGLTVTRLASQDDYAAVDAMHARSSLESRASRYRTGRQSLRPAEWSALTDPGRGLSWVTCPAGRPRTVIAVTHLLRTGGELAGELALMVEDAWQNSGLGSALARYAVAHASVLGLRSVVISTERSNERMLAICRLLGASVACTDARDPDLEWVLPAA